MALFGHILLFLLTLAGCLASGATAVVGVLKREVFHTVGAPRIAFWRTPVKFVIWTLCLVGMSAALCAIAALLAADIMNMR